MNLDNDFGPYDEIKEDLKFITSSDIRVRIIISLKEGQKKLVDLKKEVHTNSSTILHNIRQLESRNLIKKEFQNYSLSQTGKIVAINIINIVNTFSVIKKNKDFWIRHEINGIPEHLIGEIECLGDFKVIKSIPTDLVTYKELLLNSMSIKCIIPDFNDFDEFFFEILNQNEHIELILTGGALKKMLEKLNLYSQTTGDEKNLKLHEINSLKLLLIVTNELILLNLPLVDGKYDFDEFLISKSGEAIEWGNKVFNYYLKMSKEFK